MPKQLICQCPLFNTDDCNKECIQIQELRKQEPAIIIKGDMSLITPEVKVLFNQIRDLLGLPEINNENN